MPYSTLNDLLPEIAFNEPVISPIKSDWSEKNNVQVFMLRLDDIHPAISGNKLFKLIYFLEEAKESSHQTMLTFGGPYSNHLAATAFAGKALNLKSIAIVRGQKPKTLSQTLLFCLKQGMHLEFISRTLYQQKNENNFLQDLKTKFGNHILIPEGGFCAKGKEGASLINQYFTDKNFTHICLPVGTATTFAGIVDANKSETQIIGFPVLKNFNDVQQRFEELKVNCQRRYSLITDYHFGGYAKKTGELISFIKNFYATNKIELDFVYTAKMMFGIYHLIEKKFFKEGSKILSIHTGGLQGNQSLQINFKNSSVKE
jgi:1-aminocyclopropane-1-carboxylate deaminase